MLRLGHRIERDKRITTHVCLVARAFGAEKVILTTRDSQLKETVEKLVAKFGDSFRLEYCKEWRKFLSTWQGTKIHLTMYGEHINEVMSKLPKDQSLLIVIGAEKVPSEVYKLVDFNIAVGNQPHSEVAALAVFLDRYFKGKELERKFSPAKLIILPAKRGKRVKKIQR